MGLLSPSGQPLVVQLDNDAYAWTATERVLVMTEAEQRFTFTGITEGAIPSLLRGYSAPVQLDDGLSDAELLVLLAHDSDAFNRWEAGQRLLLGRICRALSSDAPLLDNDLANALQALLRDPSLAPAFKALALTLPSEGYVAEQVSDVDPQRIHAVCHGLRQQLAARLQADWVWAFEAHQVQGAYRPNAEQSGLRALANLALGMLTLNAVATGDAVWPGRAFQRSKDASNMTERLGAVEALVNAHAELAAPALQRLHAQYGQHPLVLDKWFQLQARAPEQDGKVFARVKQLLQHPDFTLANPNRVRALVFSLTHLNPGAFHRADAAGYVLWAERVMELDASNPQIASRLARALDRWRSLAEPYRSAARVALERVAAKAELSSDTREIIARALQD
jgi:aminopeptidase N